MLSGRVYAGRIHKFTEPELKQKILKAWQELGYVSQKFGLEFIFLEKETQACKQDGGHIEHLL